MFVRAFRRRREYVPQHPTALPWLYWLAGSVIADNARHERRRLRLLARLSSTAAGQAAAAPHGSVAPEVTAALRKLSPELRETLLVVVWGELSYEEAATALGVAVGTVASRLARARAELQADGTLDPLRPITYDTGGAHA